MATRRSALALSAGAALACGWLAAGCASGARREGDLTSVPTPAPFVSATTGPLVVRVKEGFTAVPIARGLNMPSGITFDSAGDLCVLEAGGFLGNNPGRTPPRIVVLSPSGELGRVIELKGTPVVFPATGIAWHAGSFFISHRDANHLGVISRVAPDGTATPIVRDLPSQGDHSTNQLVFGGDGKLYFAQGSATNSGVVGIDDFVAFGWPEIHPEVHDVPAKNLVVNGKNFATTDPRGASPDRKATTGAWKPFGVPAERGDEVRGAVRANGSILRVDEDGRSLEVYAWGLRNPFGLGFAPDGKLHASLQGMDLRGSRPIANDVDALLAVRKDAWYGWPDFTTDLRPLLDDRDHAPPGDLGKPAEPLIDLGRSALATPDPGDLVATFPGRPCVCGFTWAPPGFGTIGGALVLCELGPLAPSSDPFFGGAPGSRVVLVSDGKATEDLLANTAPGPASRHSALGRGLERPIDVKPGPDGALYVVDYGVVNVKVDPAEGVTVQVREGTGAIWRVQPAAATALAPVR
jgi:glucose/arabinose dehydrogenase